MKKLILGVMVLGSFFVQNTINAGSGHVDIGFRANNSKPVNLKSGDVSVMQSGKKLVGALLKSGGVSVKRLYQVQFSGALDTSFGPNGTGFYTTKSIYSDLEIKVKPNGKILLTGLNKQGQHTSVELNSHGILDSDGVES